MTNLATPIRNAAYMLFDNGLTFDEVNIILKGLEQPSEGYVYLEDVCKHLPTLADTIKGQ